MKINGSTILSVCGLIAALVGTAGYLRSANAVMLGANIIVLVFAGVKAWSARYARRRAQMHIPTARDHIGLVINHTNRTDGPFRRPEGPPVFRRG